MSLVFYTNPQSRGRMVRFMLEEVGVDYETITIPWGEHKKPEFLSLNPMGKLPTLVHNGVVITETAAICAYLADAFPDSKLAPLPNSPERARYYRWMFFAAGPIESVVSNTALGVVVPPDKKGMIGYGSLEDVLATIEVALKEGQYLCGEQFTAADVYFGSLLSWATKFKIIESTETIDAYLNKLSLREAAKRAAKLDDDALRQLTPTI